MASIFPSICEELSQMQVQLLRREVAPLALAREAIKLIRAHPHSLEATRSNEPYIPIFLRSCASLLKNVSKPDELAALDALDLTCHLAKFYVHANDGDVNASSSVLRSIMALEESQNKLNSANTPNPRFLSGTNSGFSDLILPSYHSAYNKWRRHYVKAHTLSVLTLLRGSSAIHGRQFLFAPVSADITGLLPIKSKVEMEAKVQRCSGARELLYALREMECSRLDAGMSLATMSETGLYDGALCDLNCRVLHSAHALISSQQLAEVIYHLGVLQHRHVHQRFFSSLINPKNCNATAVRRHVLGLAMLRQPPHREKALLDGVFLHALRGRRQHKQVAAAEVHRSSEGSGNDLSSPYDLPPEWFVDIGHALAVLGVHHVKYQLTAARHARRCIARWSTTQRCKLLYSLSGIPIADVPPALKAAWQSKVERTKAIVIEKLNDIKPDEGPRVMHCLLFCGVEQHPRIPRTPPLRGEENPVELLLRTWTSSPKEQVLHLTEQIEPSYFNETTIGQLVKVVRAVADACPQTVQHEQYRFGPLCAAVDAHAAELPSEDALHILNCFEQIGISGEYLTTLQLLLDNLWRRRHDLTSEELQQCCRIAGSFPQLEAAHKLAEFAAER